MVYASLTKYAPVPRTRTDAPRMNLYGPRGRKNSGLAYVEQQLIWENSKRERAQGKTEIWGPVN